MRRRLLAALLRPRMLHWFLVSLALLAGDFVFVLQAAQEIRPNPLHLVVHKADMVTWGAWLGWVVDQAVDPDGTPNELRRGLIIAAAILGFALGL